jgi:hypothetical protein
MWPYVAGILFVIVDTELRFADTVTEDSAVSLMLKILTTISTACLLLSIVAYHVTGLRLHMASAGFQVRHFYTNNIQFNSIQFKFTETVLIFITKEIKGNWHGKTNNKMKKKR